MRVDSVTQEVEPVLPVAELDELEVWLTLVDRVQSYDRRR